jgi:hypothetical protein
MVVADSQDSSYGHHTVVFQLTPPQLGDQQPRRNGPAAYAAELFCVAGCYWGCGML